ncbi:hypothetical protein VNI00_013963 [Paramarasmius palmivorus]|uniref:Extracellular membrane protein CFEM domain-containing protein n=1 Tax=Paramarasmius palmivorus TaxID=297713 RepID=A0AAW0BVU5_9AGAR
MAKSSALFFAIAVVGSTSASFVARNPLASLAARQSSGFDPSVIPTQCQSQCAAIVSDIQGCETSSNTLCGCTTSNAANMRQCFACFIDIAPTVQSQIQSTYDDYVRSCNSIGGNIPSGSIGGGSVSVTGGASGTSEGIPTSRSVTGITSRPTSTSVTSGDDEDDAFSSNTPTRTRTTVSGEQTGVTNGDAPNSNAPGGGGNGAVNVRGNWALVSGVFEIRGSLFRKQSGTGGAGMELPSNIPSSCRGVCNIIINTINTCATFQCLCTPGNSNNLTSCVDCIVAIKPNQTVIEEAQGILNQFGAICNDAGSIPIPTQTASGFSGVVGSPGMSTSGLSGVDGSSSLATQSVTETVESSDTGSSTSVLGSQTTITSVSATESPSSTGSESSDATSAGTASASGSSSSTPANGAKSETTLNKQGIGIFVILIVVILA